MMQRMASMAKEAEAIRQKHAQPEIGGDMIWQDPICEMEINITPQLLTYASIPGLVDMVIEQKPDSRKDDFGLKKKILPNKRV